MLLPVLLMQVWVVGAGQATGGRRAECTMDCCAWLVEAGLSEGCVCAEDSGAPKRPIPALPSGETGAGKVAQLGWVFADERFQPTGVGIQAGEVQICICTVGAEEQPHVRLTVLFGAFLI
jgi:hypothetical protein